MDLLVAEHFAAEDHGPRGARLLRVLRPFREDDPVPTPSPEDDATPSDPVPRPRPEANGADKPDLATPSHPVPTPSLHPCSTPSRKALSPLGVVPEQVGSSGSPWRLGAAKHPSP